MTILEQRAVDPDRGTELSDRSYTPNWLWSLVGLAGVLAFLTARGAQPLTDPDTWWHLEIGRRLWGEWSISSPGSLSEFATQPWTARDWLSQMVASRFEDLFGLAGVSWLAGALYLACAVALWFGSRAFAGPLASTISTAVGTAALTIGLTPRPQVVSFLLLSLFVTAWLRSSLDLRPRWYLVPLTALWACSHGMWIVGVLLGIVMVLGLIMQGRLDLPAAARLLAIPAGGVLLSMLTPGGTGVLLSAVESSSARGYIAEWQPTSFLSPQPFLVALTIAVVLTSALRSGNLPWPQVLLVLMAAGWTALSMRSVALGAVMITPLLAMTVQSWIPTRRLPRVRARERWGVGLLVLGCLVALAGAVASSPRMDDHFPVTLDERLESAGGDGVVLNAYMLGGWLEWRHPDLAVVIDGNTPAYEEQYIESYMHATALAPGWYDFVESTHATMALVSGSSPIAEGLRLRGWRLEAEDEHFVLLSRPQLPGH